MRGVTYFSGGGIFEALLKDTIEWIGAVEIEPTIARVYEQNHGSHIIVDSVCNVLPEQFGHVDYFHASPVCKEFSNAKVNGAESAIDIASAEAVAAFIRSRHPRYVTIENVRKYLKSKSYRIIERALMDMDYWVDVQVVNAADFGVPQTRERMIVRAVSGGMFQPFSPLPPRQKWRGWYEAIEDLIPTLPDSQFAPWQLELLPSEPYDCLMNGDNTSSGLKALQNRQPAFTIGANCIKNAHRAFVVSGGNEYTPARVSSNPIFTIGVNASTHSPRAFIVDGQTNANGSTITIRADNEPMFTCSASQEKRPTRAWLEHGRVVKMTPRALARFQSIPDDYQLPENKTLAGTIIGNGVPSLMAREIALSLIR